MTKSIFQEAFEAVKTEIHLQFTATQKFEAARICAVNHAGEKSLIARLTRAGGYFLAYDEKANGIIINYGNASTRNVEFLPYAEIASISAEIVTTRI